MKTNKLVLVEEAVERISDITGTDNTEHKYSEEKNYLGPFCDYRLVLTNHSKPYEADVSELKSKIIEYQNMIGETNEALKLFGE